MKYPLNWQNNLDVTLSSSKCIVVSGNIHDTSFFDNNLMTAPINMRNSVKLFATPMISVIEKIVKEGKTRLKNSFDVFYVYSPVLKKFTKTTFFKQADKEENKTYDLKSISNTALNYDELTEMMTQSKYAICLVLELYNMNDLNEKNEIYNYLLSLFKTHNVNDNFGLIILDNTAPEVCGGEDIASSFCSNAPFAKLIRIPKPNEDVVRRFLKGTVCTDGMKFSDDGVVSAIIGLTDGYYGQKYMDLASFFNKYKEDYVENGGKVDINDRLFFETAVDMFQNGNRDNRWDRSMVELRGIMEEYFTGKDAAVVGQDKVKKKVVDSLRKATQGFGHGADGNNIRGILVFAGPTGTGKTFTARMMAKGMFNSESYLIRIDMANFNDEISVNSLLGVAAGYVGHDSPIQFIQDIKTKGYAILLFDEFEKAHPKMLDIFLQMLDSGHITDHASGTKTSLKDVFIVMTTNLGADAETEEGVIDAIEKWFASPYVNRREIFGRIGRNNVAVFKRHDKESYKKMFGKEFMKIQGLLRNRYPGVILERPSEATSQTFVDTYYEDDGREKGKEGLDLGGRGLKDKMSQIINNLISEELYNYELTKGAKFNRNATINVSIGYENGVLKAYVR